MKVINKKIYVIAALVAAVFLPPTNSVPSSPISATRVSNPRVSSPHVSKGSCSAKTEAQPPEHLLTGDGKAQPFRTSGGKAAAKSEPPAVAGGTNSAIIRACSA